MPSWLSSLRVRLVVLVLIAVVPAFGLILWTNLEERSQERDHAEQNMLSLAQVVGAQQEQLIEGSRQFLGTLVGLVSGSDEPIDPESCSAAMGILLTQNPRYANVGFASADGTIFCSGLPQTQSTDASQRSWFQQAVQTRQFAVGNFEIGTTAKQQTISFSYPVLDRQGDVRLVIFSVLDLAWLNDQAAQIQLPEGAVLTIGDSSGVILVRSPEPDEWVGQSVPETPLFQAMLASPQGTAELVGVDDVRRVYAFTRLGEPGQPYAYLSVGLSTETVFGAANEALVRNLALLGVVAVLALLAAWFGGDWFILSGVRVLVRAARRVGEGDLRTRTGLAHDRGEIGQLARAFDEMSEAMERRERERMAAEEALRETEQRFRSFVEHAADAIFMVNERGTIVATNPASERMFGYAGDELVGSSVDTLLPDALRSRHIAHRAAFWSSPDARAMGAGMDLHARRKDGSEFPVAIGLTPLSAAGERLVAATVSDVTAQKRAEERLKQTVEDLGRSNRELEQFAYVASHDLQEPLRMVGNYTQLLARRYHGKLDGDADEFIGYAVDGAKRMQALINDLLSLSRVGTRGKELAVTDTEAVFSRTLEDLQAAMAEANAQITHDLLPHVLADDVQLGQLLQNLIGNAIKFAGDGAPQVHVSARPDGDRYVFSVRDNGIGIAQDYFEKIFVIFQRLHARQQYPGTGIGLAVCKKIVERHGGRIWVESEPGKGATFYFTLPAAREALVAA